MMTEREYRKHPAYSQSQLKVFKESIPRFHARYVAKTIDEPEPSEEMRVGTALHCAIFNPSGFDKQYVKLPKLDLRKKDDKVIWADFQAKHAGKEFLKPDQYELVRDMAESVESSFWWQDHIEPIFDLAEEENRFEVPLFWNCPDTGIALKGLLDVIGNGFLVDVKTTTEKNLDPSNWRWVVKRFKYHWQAYVYLWGYSQNLGVDLHDLRFLQFVVSKEPPYEVAVFQYPQLMIDIACDDVIGVLRELRDCLEADDWRGRWSVQPAMIENFPS